MYELYVDKCKEVNMTHVKEWQYHLICNNEFKFSFHQRHSDTCNKCDFFYMALKSAKTECEVKDMQDWKNLQELPSLIPPLCYEFYTSLIHTGQSLRATSSVGRG
jgi:hypothetical protein